MLQSISTTAEYASIESSPCTSSGDEVEDGAKSAAARRKQSPSPLPSPNALNISDTIRCPKITRVLIAWETKSSVVGTERVDSGFGLIGGSVSAWGEESRQWVPFDRL
ncbi:hypothetical protein L1887_14581 [Cichorium endivia]|nr:hypothetical protein L1887_14581 [Cichorium endivia]